MSLVMVAFFRPIVAGAIARAAIYYAKPNPKAFAGILGHATTVLLSHGPVPSSPSRATILRA